MRTVAYKEDSTKGRSVLNPQEYKGDSLIQCWVDSRKIAMLSIWLDNNGMVTRHLSDVMKMVIDIVVDQLLEAGEVEKIEFCAEAREMLERKYLAKLNPGERGKKNLLHNLVLDDRRKGAMGRSDHAEIDKTGNEKIAQMQKDAMEKYEEKYGKVASEGDGHSDEIEALLGKTDEVFKGPSSVVDDEYLEKERQKSNEQKVNDMTAKSSHTPSDRPRSKSSAELDVEAVRLEKKDADYAEQLKNM